MQSINGYFEKNCQLVGAPLVLAVTTTCISIILCLLNIFGNILIIFAVVLDPNKNLRTPFNWLLVNLAIADLVVGIITDPSSAVFHFQESLGTTSKHLDAQIKVLHLSYFISCTASALSISTLAVERYLAVRKPNVYRANFSRKRIILTIAFIWIISLSFPSIYFEAGYIVYAFIFANASVFVAISMACFTYTLIWRKMKARSQVLTNNNARETSPASNEREMAQRSSSCPSNLNPANSIITSAQEMEAKVTKTYLVVLIAMFCCYGPALIFIYLMNFCESCGCLAQHWFRDLQFVLTLTNSSLNFCCYAMQSSRFQSAFIKILNIKKRSSQRHGSFRLNRNSPSNGCPSNTTNTSEDAQVHKMVKIVKTNGTVNEGSEV